VCEICREIFDSMLINVIIKEEKKMAKCPVCGKDGYEGEEDIEGEEYIYEKLSPGDVLIISREEDSFLVAENKDGNIQIRRTKI